MIDQKHLPVALPDVDKYLPTEDGKPPLGNSKEWAWDTINNKVVANSLIDNKSVFRLELNTMPGWAGSSWYFNRYMDSNNNQEFASKESLDYWKEVDVYIGGSEHATGHLLYSRFWQYFLYDLDLVPVKDYAKKLINQGMILGNSAFISREVGTDNYFSKEIVKNVKTQLIHVDVQFVNTNNELDLDALRNWQPQFKNAHFESLNNKFIVHREVEKMSKSKYNVINPDHIIEEFGADSLRLYEMFMGPLEQVKPWSTKGVDGVNRFLHRAWRLLIHDEDGELKSTVSDIEPTKEQLKVLHTAIKKVSEDIEAMRFNTAISALMIFVNEANSWSQMPVEVARDFIQLLSPFAPHISEELWAKLGHQKSLAYQEWPAFDEQWLVDDEIMYPIQINGKVRADLYVPAELAMNKEYVLEQAKALEKIQGYLEGSRLVKEIFVPKRIVNLVIAPL